MPEQIETALDLLLRCLGDHFSLLGLLSWRHARPELLGVILLPREESLPEKISNIKESRARDGRILTPDDTTRVSGSSRT